MVAWLALALSAVATLISWRAYRRTVAADRAVSWRVEQRGRDHVLVNDGPGVAHDVRIELPDGNSAVSWGLLEHARLDKDAVVRIGTFAPASAYVHPDVITIRWRVGRRSHAVQRQIL